MSMPRAPTPALVWLGRVLAYAVLALFTLGVVYPLAAVVFDSLKSQNKFFLALLFIHNPDLLTLPLGLQTFFFQYHVQWPYYFAALSTAIIPVVIVYLVLQRQFVSGITAGAVRG
jgi:raffinose/stachyose/melibiose transport system permease protein